MTNATDESGRIDTIDDADKSDSASDGGEDSQHSGAIAPWTVLDFDGFETDDRATTLDENAPGLDGELVAQTGFDPDDGESDHWEWLKELNNGRGEGGRSEQIRADGIARDLDIIASNLGLSDYQRDRVEHLLRVVDVKDTLLTRGPIEAAILGVATIVVDEDRTRYARMDGANHVQSVMRDESFDQLLRDYDLARSTIHDVRYRLRDTAVYANR